MPGSGEGQQALFAKLLTDESRNRVRALLQTRLRKSEFLGLRGKDVDLKAAVLTIPRSTHGETRHAFPSRLAMEGVDLLAIKEFGGWHRSQPKLERRSGTLPSERSRSEAG